ncbi:MAG: NADH-quinone oxidoreductase subunit K [Armatimonadota bacterium]|nr:NADH-quinone oxidoreductase subunit K [Armatimonadota bacterium]
MAAAVALLVGVLVATGLYLLLGRSLLRQIIGLALLSHAANIMLLLSAGLRGGVPVIGASATPTDPLPQALILTAIVISFGITAFLLALGYRMHLFEGGEDRDDG